MVSGFLNRATSNHPKAWFGETEVPMIISNYINIWVSKLFMGTPNISKSSKILRSMIFGVPILGNLHIYYTMFLLQLQDTARYKPKNDETTSKKWWWSDLAFKRSQPFSWSAVATTTNQPWNALVLCLWIPKLGLVTYIRIIDNRSYNDKNNINTTNNNY